MHFALSEEQVALRDATRELLARRCTPEVVRSAWPAGDRSVVDGLWRELDRLGLLDAASGDVDDVGMVALLAEVGYAAVPLPVAVTAMVARPLLDPLPGPVALVDESAAPVHYARVASAFLVLDARSARMVEAGAVELTPVSTVDGSLAAAVVRVPDGAGRELPGADPAVLRDRATLGTAAELVGLGRRMLELTVGYVSRREQFGVPVGGFQAVAHPLADALLRIEFAAPAVLAAAWSGTPRDVSAAALLAKEAAEEVASTALQSHGAMAYTVEYDLHLYAKRAWALASTVDTDAHLDRLARALDLPTSVT